MATAPTFCEEGIRSSGAVYRICMPEPGAWNGDLVVFAHGYVAPGEPVAIPEDQLTLPDGTSIPDLVNKLGFAFATTSYRHNGLVVKEGIEDLVDLVNLFIGKHGDPGHVYLGGGSEGGLITALAIEKHPVIFDGGVASCGPVGDFYRQTSYLGDFRVVFDYFFPGVIPGSPMQIPPEVIRDWDGIHEPDIRNAIQSNPHATEQLLRVTRVPTDRSDPDSVEETILGVLWYNVFATNDGTDKLGGQPFDNSRRLYFGSDSDFRLNRKVQRFRADPTALEEIEANYQTSGQLVRPLVTLHTTGDPIVPYWHERLYRRKVRASGCSRLHTNIPVFRYGHCDFKVSEVLVAFALLVLKVTGQELAGAQEVLPDADSRAEFTQLGREHGALR